MRWQAMSAPGLFPRFDAVTVGAEQLEVAHLLSPELDPDRRRVHPMCRPKFCRRIDVVDVEHSAIIVAASDALSPKIGDNGSLLSVIALLSAAPPVVFKPAPVRHLAFVRTKLPAISRWRAAAGTRILVAETVLTIAVT
jgi:hypothetical protein